MAVSKRAWVIALVAVVGVAAVAFVFWRVMAGSDGSAAVSVEQAVQREINEKTTSDVVVDCPESVPQREGESVVCDVRGEDGSSGRVHIRQITANGAVEWTLNGPLTR